MPYRAPAWLPGGHAQTILARFIKPAPPAYRRQRWDTPDGDFIDADWIDVDPLAAHAPLLVLFHGLEGSSHSHYAISAMHEAKRRGWAGVVPHFRGCSGEINRLPRGYHSGDSAEIDWILRRLKAEHGQRQLYAVGVSLGGNALLKWLGEQGSAAATIVSAAAAVCPPIDLAACGHQLARGLNRVYSQYFLRTLKAGAAARLLRHPGLFDPARMLAARNLWQFDEVVTGPLHGYAGADDYWQRASSLPLLRGVGVRTLLLTPANDPFFPPQSLPRQNQLSPDIRLESPATGGHVGFVHGAPPGRIDWLAQRLCAFFSEEDQRS
jgi:predicted alpha/beta-fold hydrolase